MSGIPILLASSPTWSHNQKLFRLIGTSVVVSGLSREIRLFKLVNLASRNQYHAYTIAISSVVLATLIRFGIDPHIVPPAPFATYYPIIILVAFFCGLGPAVVALWLSGLTAWYFFLPPPYTFAL